MLSPISSSSVLFVLITFCIQNQVLSSPVVLWSNENLPKSAVPLSTLSPLDLISDYICKLTNEQIQLHLFAVNDLTIEDIHQGLQHNYPLLSNIKKDQTQFRYYPNVAKDIYQPFSLLPQSNNMKCSHIHFQLASSHIYETLHQALNDMQTKIERTDTDGNNAVVIALINHPTNGEKLSRQRRETGKNKIILSDTKACMFYAKNLTWDDANGAKESNRSYGLNSGASTCVQNISTTNGNHSSAILNLVWINQKTPLDIVNMRINATMIGLYWYLTNVSVNGSEYRYFAYGMHSQMDTPPTFSYVCTTATFVQYDGASKYGKYNFSDRFSIKHFQFQPFHGNGSFFGPPNYCTSFFTSGIWMGITSSLLCLGILLFGIHRIMMIKSNDRFDDPKGKPLIIKAQE